MPTSNDTPRTARLRALTDDYRALADKLRLGGGAKRVEKMHAKGQLSPRERVAKLLDPGAPWLEIGLLVAHDRYNGEAPAAGVITGVGMVQGREVVVVANDATVKARTARTKTRTTPNRPISQPVSGTAMPFDTAKDVMTQVPWSVLAPRLPAMVGSDTLAIVVSSTCMKVPSASAIAVIASCVP